MIQKFSDYVTSTSKPALEDLKKVLGELKTAIEGMSGRNREPTGTGTSGTGNMGFDVFSPAGKSKTITDGFGQMLQLPPEDEILAAPNTSEFINLANKAFATIGKIEGATNNLGIVPEKTPIQNIINPEDTSKKSMIDEFFNFVKNINDKNTSEPIESLNINDILKPLSGKLNEVNEIIVNQNTTTTNEVKGSVGVEGDVTFNVNMPNNALNEAFSRDKEFQTTLKNEMMKVVEYRLSEDYKRRQNNLS